MFVPSLPGICREGSQEGQAEGLLLSPRHWQAPLGPCGWAQLGLKGWAVAGTALCSSLSLTLGALLLHR